MEFYSAESALEARGQPHMQLLDHKHRAASLQEGWIWTSGSCELNTVPHSPPSENNATTSPMALFHSIPSKTISETLTKASLYQCSILPVCHSDPCHEYDTCFLLCLRFTLPHWNVTPSERLFLTILGVATHSLYNLNPVQYPSWHLSYI